MTKVCVRRVRERENEIRRQAVHSTQMRNELSCYSHSVQDIEQMLKKNMGYYTSGPFMRMKRDIEAYLQAGNAAADGDAPAGTPSENKNSESNRHEKGRQ